MTFNLTITSLTVSVLLIFLLAIREILRWESERESVDSLLKGLNIIIIPLLLIFAVIFAYNVISIL
jgi:hypothetical protein